MIRLKLIRVFQTGAMGPIRVYKRARPADAPQPLLDPEQRHAEDGRSRRQPIRTPTITAATRPAKELDAGEQDRGTTCPTI